MGIDVLEVGQHVEMNGAGLEGFTQTGLETLEMPVAQIARHGDSVGFCVSKGLSAPFGSVLCGSTPFIERARAYRRWPEEYETEIDNIRNALVWSLDQGDIEAGLRLCRLSGWDQVTRDWEQLKAAIARGELSAVDPG